MHRRLGLRQFSHLRSPAPPSDPQLALLRSALDEIEPSVPPPELRRGSQEPRRDNGGGKQMAVEIAHPWPEWVALMELLLKKGHLEPSAFAGTSSSPAKDSNQIRTACLDFGRERPELIRYLSRLNIRIAVQCGCPSIDRKVVNSGKRLRAYVGLDEGEVCSRCNLRGSCERAYVKARKEEIGRTVDVMRVVLTHGLHIITGPLENRACLHKTVKESVKNLLKEIVELDSKEPGSNIEKAAQQMPKGHSAVPMMQGDWVCPKCNFMNFARNMKCLRCNGEFQERYQMLHEDQEHLPLKKGDWICEKCNFLNFAKNTRCLQCHENPTNRLLNLGEWECVSCNYLNFKRNAFCLRCGWKRPKSLNNQDTIESRRGDLKYNKKPDISFVQDGIEPTRRQFPQRKTPSEEDTEDGGSSGDSGCFLTQKDGFFIDSFPIVSGRTLISEDPIARDKWKEETSRTGKGVPTKGAEENNCPSNPAPVRLPRSMELVESGGDDEISSWFAGARINRNMDNSVEDGGSSDNDGF